MAIITICRGTRSGGEALAACVAERLGWPALGREALQLAAAEVGVTEEQLVQKMQEAPRLWDRHMVARRAYVVALQAALAERVAEGDLVYHGVAGQLLLRGLPAVLRVRLIAPLQTRVRAVMERDGLGRDAAARHIARQDASRARWVRMMYGEDIADPQLYDLVVSLETMDVRDACALLEAALRQPDFDLTPAVLARLAEFRLACRVRFALVRDGETRAHNLEVEAHGTTIEVSGSAPLLTSGRTGERIAAVARAVPGVESVRLKLQWFDPYP